MGQYDDIIHLPHHVSSRHPRMSMIDRAAQFSPFAALTGYDAAIKETGRLTDQKLELGEEARAILDQKQSVLHDHIHEQPLIRVTYFVPDQLKDGGSYTTITAHLKKIDEYNRCFIMTDGSRISLDEISEIESNLFRGIL